MILVIQKYHSHSALPSVSSTDTHHLSMTKRDLGCTLVIQEIRTINRSRKSETMPCCIKTPEQLQQKLGKGKGWNPKIKLPCFIHMTTEHSPIARNLVFCIIALSIGYRPRHVPVRPIVYQWLNLTLAHRVSPGHLGRSNPITH